MSDAPNTDRELDNPSVLATEVAQVRWARRRSLVVASCIGATVVAIAAWRAASAHPPAAWIGRSVAAGTLGLASGVRAESPAIAQAAAASSAPVKPAAPAVPVAPAVPASVTKELAELKSAYERLALRAQDTEQRLDRIESDVAQLKQQFEKQQVALALARKRARHDPPRARTAQAIVQVQTPPAPRILGVDTWNGQPSVSVLVGTEVRFFSEGDVVANALVKRADSASQRVEFVTGSGAAIATSSASGEAQ